MKIWDLNGQWTLTRHAYHAVPPETTAELDAPSMSLTATVPGNVHADLLAAGLIKDPLYGDQYKEAKWVNEYDWCYTREFTVDKPERRTELEFDGLDTFATVYLNGKKVGDAENMHIAHRFVVDDLIKEGKNTVSVYLRSVEEIAKKFPTEGLGGCFYLPRLFMRKAQCQFGWDWAPYLPSVGIWKNARVVTRYGNRIKYCRFNTWLDGRVTMFFEIDGRGALWSGDEQECELRLISVDVPAANRTYTVRLQVKDGDTVIYEGEKQAKDYKEFMNFTISSPKLWWPHDMGDQPMYDYTLTYIEDGVESDVMTGRFAVRTVALNEEPREGGEEGLKCELLVNGEPAFMRGGNWVPLDCFPGVVDEARYRRAITMAKEANITGFRVWGGGICEKDEFFDICDELGILIWQDFGFACADVPDDYPGLMDEVEKEIVTIVQRLANHPSIAIWCGGNEHSGCFGYYPSKGIKHFYYLIRGLVGDTDPSRPYVESSPFSYHNMGGIGDSGDSHASSYNIANIDWNFRRKDMRRFTCGMATEIGNMGFPPLTSLRKYIPEEALTINSEIIDMHFVRNPHDASGRWFQEMEYELANEMFGHTDDFFEFAKRSALVQAEYVKVDIPFQRARKLNCSAALLWMYNDCWPCGTWSIIDYYLEPKAAYYAMRQVCKPVATFITDVGDDELAAYVVNDTRRPVTGKLTFRQMDLDGTVAYTHTQQVTVPGSTSVKAYVLDGYDYARPNSFAVATFESEQGKSRFIYFPQDYKEVKWTDPKLTSTAKQVDANHIELTLKTENYARFVRLQGLGDGVSYCDNYFDMIPGEEKTVSITADHPINAADITVDHWLTEWKV